MFLFSLSDISRNTNFHHHLRHFDFSPRKVEAGDPDARPFLDAVRIVLGLTSQDESVSDSLLTSLHSELAFNDMRDATRRHAKKERAGPCSFHSVAMKSAAARGSGCKPLILEDADWATPLSRTAIQTSVHSALRLTDRSLGIPTSGLTKCKAPLLTKPHILCQRLTLLKVLQGIFEETRGSVEEKRDACLSAFHDLWISKLVGEHTFIREKSSNAATGQHPELVLRAGPYSVLTLGLTPASADDPGTYTLSLPTSEISVKCLDKFELAPVTSLVEPVSGTLVFKAETDFVSLTKFVALHGILQVAPGVLRSLCSRMKIPKAGNLTHKLRVELFLKTMECSEEYIQEILAQIPDKAPRKRKQGTTEGESKELSAICHLWFA